MKKALVSVSDKTGLIDFAKELAKQFEIISTGGTFQFLCAAGILAQKVEDYTGVPELLGGRVKTLHPNIFAGILSLEEEDFAPPISLVVVNLYPKGKGEIDIGGSALLRAAAKNFERVLAVCDPADYSEVAARLCRNEVDREFRRTLAAKAFRLTAAYDAAIAASMGNELLPEQFTCTYTKLKDLAYGENPSSQAALYVNSQQARASAATASQLQGKELSYNNILDADSAYELVKKFSRPACAIIKHNNPCGVAIQDCLSRAFMEAFEADPLCAFGGIIACNSSVDVQTATEIAKHFFDVLIAPEYDEQALVILKAKNQLRVLKTAAFDAQTKRVMFKQVTDGLLVQTISPLVSHDSWRVATQAEPSKEQLRDLLLAVQVNEDVKSNSSVIVRNGVAVGIGAGQMSRIDSVRLALGKAKERAIGAVLSSDGFFPFADSIEAAAQAGIKAIVQPGGSKQDREVIDACNRHGIAMVLTGQRLFKH